MIEDVIKKLEKQPRTPRNLESIKKGALELELKDKVALRNILTDSIDIEIKDMQEKLTAATALVSPPVQR